VCTSGGRLAPRYARRAIVIVRSRNPDSAENRVHLTWPQVSADRARGQRAREWAAGPVNRPGRRAWVVMAVPGGRQRVLACLRPRDSLRRHGPGRPRSSADRAPILAALARSGRGGREMPVMLRGAARRGSASRRGGTYWNSSGSRPQARQVTGPPDVAPDRGEDPPRGGALRRAVRRPSRTSARARMSWRSWQIPRATSYESWSPRMQAACRATGALDHVETRSPDREDAGTPGAVAAARARLYPRRPAGG